MRDASQMRSHRHALYLLASCLALELCLFAWLCSLGHDAFMRFIWTPDTPGYVRVAVPLAESSRLVAGPRTLGYPLFLAASFVVGGRYYGFYLVIAAQLLLNLAFTWGGWKLLERTVPDSGLRLRVIASMFLFWAGLGMALYIMTDFLAAFFFGIFLYGLFFWRKPALVGVAGAALALATLTRPTFTFMPLLLPPAAYLIGRFTTKVPKFQLAALIVCSMAATAISVGYQYASYKYLGPSPFLVTPIQENLYHAFAKRRGSPEEYLAFKKEFESKIESRSKRRFETLAPGEQERYAKEIFKESLIAHPRPIITNLIKTFVKYLFVPVESTTLRLTEHFKDEGTYFGYLRPVLVVLCLPIWLAALIPPIAASRQLRAIHLVVLMLALYIIGASSIGPGSGERIRFPLLAFMMPAMVWNLFQAGRRVRARFGRHPAVMRQPSPRHHFAGQP